MIQKIPMIPNYLRGGVIVIFIIAGPWKFTICNKFYWKYDYLSSSQIYAALLSNHLFIFARFCLIKMKARTNHGLGKTKIFDEIVMWIKEENMSQDWL